MTLFKLRGCFIPPLAKFACQESLKAQHRRGESGKQINKYPILSLDRPCKWVGKTLKFLIKWSKRLAILLKLLEILKNIYHTLIAMFL